MTPQTTTRARTPSLRSAAWTCVARTYRPDPVRPRHRLATMIWGGADYLGEDA